jgi:hypothetical protein
MARSFRIGALSFRCNSAPSAVIGHGRGIQPQSEEDARFFAMRRERAARERHVAND